MKTSAAGRVDIKRREGVVLHTYYDSVNVLTGGVGHTGRMAPPKLTPGMTITQEMADAWLEADLGPVERALNAALTVPVTQNEFDALASLIFNVGVGYAKPSMVIIKNLNLGNVKAAADGFDQFHKPAAIIGRRNSEKAQFLRPDAPVGAVPTPVVVQKRAATLDAKAATATKSASADTKIATVGAVIAAGAVAAQPVVHQSHGVLWIAAIAFALLAAAGITIAVLSRRKAATLTANAEAHRAALPHLDAGTTDLATALQQ